jgi:hypothetical protein
MIELHVDNNSGGNSPRFDPSKRPSIIHQGDVFNQKKIEREAMMLAI